MPPGTAKLERTLADLQHGRWRFGLERPPASGETGTKTVALPWPVAEAKPIVCYAWAAPDPSSDDFAPFLIGAKRILEAAMESECADTKSYWDLRYVPFAPTVCLVAPAKEPLAKPDAILNALSAPWDREQDANIEASQYGSAMGLAGTPLFRFPPLTSGDFVLAPEEQESIYSLAHGLGLREVLGFDPGKLRARLGALTEKDLERARELFAESRCARVVLEPTPVRR
jgi:hypothetical protein